LSIGYASNQQGEGLEGLFKRADASLLTSKRRSQIHAVGSENATANLSPGLKRPTAMARGRSGSLRDAT
jgi:hypothetical protein